MSSWLPAAAAIASELRKEFVAVFVVWAPSELDAGERSRMSATLSRASRIDFKAAMFGSFGFSASAIWLCEPVCCCCCCCCCWAAWLRLASRWSN